MKKNIVKVVCVSSMLLVVACGPKIKTERISLEKSDELAMTITDEWIMTDTQNAVKAILSQIEQHRGFQAYLAKLGRRPKIFIADIQNQTSEAYFPIGDLNDELLNEFSFSGDYILIDNNAREKLNLPPISLKASYLINPIF